eukprot:366000-Chlamydomonas_euryale.AAC.52
MNACSSARALMRLPSLTLTSLRAAAAAAVSLEVEPKLLSQVMRVARQDVEAQLRDPRYNYARRVIQVNSGDHPFFAPITMKVGRTIMMKRGHAHHEKDRALAWARSDWQADALPGMPGTRSGHGLPWRDRVPGAPNVSLASAMHSQNLRPAAHAAGATHTYSDVPPSLSVGCSDMSAGRVRVQDLDAVDASAALEFHNRSFCNPAEFTVIMTGRFCLFRRTASLRELTRTRPKRGKQASLATQIQGLCSFCVRSTSRSPTPLPAPGKVRLAS